jgi:hypothetical protein
LFGEFQRPGREAGSGPDGEPPAVLPPPEGHPVARPGR